MGICFIGGNRHCAALRQLHQPMLNGIFNQRLHGQCREKEITGLQIKKDFHIRETDLFNADIISNMLYLL